MAKMNLNDPRILVTFSNTQTGELIGQLIQINGEIVFEGYADEAARYFFHYLCEMLNEREEESLRAKSN